MIALKVASRVRDIRQEKQHEVALVTRQCCRQQIGTAKTQGQVNGKTKLMNTQASN
jgi:hypothetical protein